MTAPPTKPWRELQILRDRTGYTLTELALETGYSVAYLSLLQRGLRRPSPAAIKRLAEVLRVPYTMLEPQPKKRGRAT